MKHLFEHLSWREILPRCYNWLESLSMDNVVGLTPDSHHVVPVVSDKTEPCGFRILAAPMSEEVKEQIVNAAKLHAWKGVGGPLTIDVHHYLFTLVATTSVKTTSVQIGRQLGLDYANHIKGRAIPHVVLLGTIEIDPLDIFEGLAMGLYTCHAFKGKNEVDAPTEGFPARVSIAGPAFNHRMCQERVAMARAASFTRNLQDAPPNVLDSVHFGKIAAEISKEFGLKCHLKGRKEIHDMGMGAFDSVARGTTVDPRLITIEIPGTDTTRTVALVGKGLTFDAGGISIKPSAGMHEMKYDMSGGAAVLGTALYFAQVKPPVNVVFIIGAVENMPGMAATRPGDIVKAMNGKTIEVQNTDAEGRLVLADALFYAARDFKPDLIVDIATLTGAVLYSLGTIGSAVMTNDQPSADLVINASKQVGEPLWQLPLWPELDKEVRSDIADFKNIASASVKAGTVVGGVFLSEFVDNRKWVHLDIAGTGWNCRATGYPQAGGSAFGLRTLIQTCVNFGK